MNEKSILYWAMTAFLVGRHFDLFVFSSKFLGRNHNFHWDELGNLVFRLSLEEEVSSLLLILTFPDLDHTGTLILTFLLLCFCNYEKQVFGFFLVLSPICDTML